MKHVIPPNGAAGGGLANMPTTSQPSVATGTEGKAVLWVGLGVAALKALVKADAPDCIKSSIWQQAFVAINKAERTTP